MSFARLHRDEAWAAKHGHVPGDLGGGSRHAFASPDPRYVDVEVKGMSVQVLERLLDESGVPKHLLDQHFAEQHRHRRALLQAKTERDQQAKAIVAQARAEHAALPPLPKIMLREERAIRTEARKHESENIQTRMHEKLLKLRHEARKSIGEPDESKLVDFTKFPRRARHVDLSKLPAPNAGGAIVVTADALRGMIVEKGISR